MHKALFERCVVARFFPFCSFFLRVFILYFGRVVVLFGGRGNQI